MTLAGIALALVAWVQPASWRLAWCLVTLAGTLLGGERIRSFGASAQASVVQGPTRRHASV